MAYENFISTVEAKKLLTERDKYLILADHCTREWEGEIKKRGDSVTVLSMARPTIYTATTNGTYQADGVGAGSIAGKGRDVIHKGIPSPEELTTAKHVFPVEQMAVFNYMVGDIDEQQSSVKGIIDRARPKTAQDMASKQDERVRDVILAKTECGLASVKLTAGEAGEDEKNILDFIDETIQVLRENNVKDSEELFGECTPKFMRLLKKALRSVDTNNSKIVRGRECTSYNGVNFFMTNILKKDTKEYAIIRTKDSVAFFDPLTHIEAYRPEGGFADALKGFNLFDAGVVDPVGCRYAEVTYVG